jgi:hypothetical protein
MPTILRIGPYRFFFYSSDRSEPAHIHVERDDMTAKFWLDPVRLDRSGGFRATEVGVVAALVREHRERLMEAWNDYFGD